jgi:hypothetical protein
MGRLIKEFKFKKIGRISTFCFGILMIALGVGLFQMPSQVYKLLDELIESDKFGIDIFIRYWYALVLLGVFICLMSILIVFYTRLTLYEEGFILEGNRGRSEILFTQLRKIEDFTSSQKKGIKFYFKDGKKSIFIDKNIIQDYSGLFHLLKEGHKISVLGKEFPDNIKEVEFQVTKDLSVRKGCLIYQGKEIELYRVSNFSVVIQERSYNFGIAIYFTRKKEKDIMIKASEMDNDDAFYKVLSTYCQEI